MSYAKRLKKLKGQWKDSVEGADELGSSLPAGTYVFELKAAEVVESTNGNLQVQWDFEVQEGEEKGTMLRQWDGIEGDDRLRWLRLRYRTLGIPEPEDISETEEAVTEAAGKGIKFRGRVKITEDGFTNLRVQKLLESGYESDDDDGEPEEDSDDSSDDEPEEDSGDDEPEEDSSDEPEPEEEAEEEEVSLAEGMVVTIKIKGKKTKGKIVGFADDDTKAQVKIGTKTYKVKIDNVDPVEEKEEKAQKKVSKKKK